MKFIYGVKSEIRKINFDLGWVKYFVTYYEALCPELILL